MSGQPPSNGSANDSIMNLNNFLARNPHHGELVWEIEDVGKPGTAEWVIKAKIGGVEHGIGKGPSHKAAKAQAAKLALEFFLGPAKAT